MQQILDKYLPFWPVLAASLVFLILGLWWQLVTSRAMELTPKPLDWVRRYRSGNFPFRQALPKPWTPYWWGLAAAVLLAAAFAAGRIAFEGILYTNQPGYYFPAINTIPRILLFGLGGGAVYWLLTTLFDSPWVALPGAALFADSIARGHKEVCLLAISLLLLLLYLRAEKPGFPSECWYLGAVLSLGVTLTVQTALVLAVPFYLLAHWYKLYHDHRHGKLGLGAMALILAASALGWALAAAAASLMYWFLLSGFRADTITVLFRPKLLFEGMAALVRRLGKVLPTRPMPGMTLDLMLDAPLLGFGFWGCRSAWTLARKRRDVRGIFVLLVLALLLLVWLVSGCYVLTLGLALTAACILNNADIAQRRTAIQFLSLASLVWYAGIQLAACWASLTPALLERMVLK